MPGSPRIMPRRARQRYNLQRKRTALGVSLAPGQMPVDALDPAFSPHAGSESDSDLDSGYSSLNDDPREPTGFYDDLLTKFENEGPTLANHGKNTKKKIREQEEKWNKLVAFSRREHDVTGR